MKMKLLFFFSFALASAAFVQHGAKLPLSNKVERLWRKVVFFRATFFVANRIEVSPYHVSFKCISSHFRGLSLRQPKLPPPPPHPLFSDLPLRSHLVLLLVRSHHPVKNIWLFFCLKVKTEQQNQSRSLQNDTGIQNTAKVVALQ